MDEFEQSGELTVEPNLQKKAQQDFASARADDEEILSTIRKLHQDHNYLLDPHSAVGVRAAEKIEIRTPVICLACAHPAKFSMTISKALGTEPKLPEALANLHYLKTRVKTVPADPETVKKMMLDTLEA